MAVIGIGIAVLASIWTVAVVLAAVLCRTRRPVSFAAPTVVLATAALITIFLWLSRTPESPTSFSTSGHVIYDYTSVRRMAVVLIGAAGLLGGVGAVFVFHVSVPRRAERWQSAWEMDHDE
jgi:hypothetical protein